MNPDSGNIYNSLPELFKEEVEQGIKVNKKHLIRFSIGQKFEIMGASFELVEVEAYPKNRIILHSLDRGIY